jgi:aspartyl-tRNA(Asn)/glutamyl-tRNA(Gln) amidotransferase subunit B
LRHIGASTANLDEGEFRCDVNVSINKPGIFKIGTLPTLATGNPLGTRSEVKNVNGIKFVMKAIEYETQRHIECLNRGEQIQKETRFYDAANGTTVLMRKKEEEVDYRNEVAPSLLMAVGFCQNLISLR